MFFNIDPRCFGPFGKFQDTQGISMQTARVSRLSFVSFDYDCILKGATDLIL